jgi:hypothetical protein
LRKPELTRFYRFNPSPPVPFKTSFFDKGFFPIGVWVHDVDNFDKIKRLALNTVLFGGTGEKLKGKVEKCHEIGLRYVISVPTDPDKLPVFLKEISGYVRPYDLAFYVNDEPGIHSFPTGRAMDVNRLIKERFPDCATCMAVVRPQVCRDYLKAADFFMMDQYPIPYMPMTWLSDSMDECVGGLEGGKVRSIEGKKVRELEGEKRRRLGDKKGVGADRLASVIQAFGGERRLDHPRLPTWQEMDCLAFLSVVHGSKGIFFYTFSWIGKTEQGRKRLGRVVGRLNRLYPWLVEKNLEGAVNVEMVSANRFDPKGRLAVHCCLKKKGDELLLIAVNTIGTYVEARLILEGEKVRRLEGEEGRRGEQQKIRREEGVKRRKAQEVFSGEDYVVVDEKIRVRFGPYEVKAFLIRDRN